MAQEKLLHQAHQYLETLCNIIPERCVGSNGNRQATQFFENTITSFGWETVRQEFNAIEWHNGGASLSVLGEPFNVLVSPYSTSCEIEGKLICISHIDQLEHAKIRGKIVLLHGEIAREQLMPKNFVFYNPEEHQHIIKLLEAGNPAAIICATGRNSATAGGVYPFPLIEDGDFDIPSVYMSDTEGNKLVQLAGKPAALKSMSQRIPAKGYNVIGRKGRNFDHRIVVTAHIDAKKGTPGAIDNASGVVVLVLLAEMLENYTGKTQIEIAALNGEDYYAVPGQMLYLKKNLDRISNIILNINIDGAGYWDGNTAFSFYGLPGTIEKQIKDTMNEFDGLTEGPQWVQGDHSIFIQLGCPAIAVTSQWFSDHIDCQDITHTPKDHPGIVDCKKLIEIARALNMFIKGLPSI